MGPEFQIGEGQAQGLVCEGVLQMQSVTLAQLGSLLVADLDTLGHGSPRTPRVARSVTHSEHLLGVTYNIQGDSVSAVYNYPKWVHI